MKQKLDLLSKKLFSFLLCVILIASIAVPANVMAGSVESSESSVETGSESDTWEDDPGTGESGENEEEAQTDGGSDEASESEASEDDPQDAPVQDITGEDVPEIVTAPFDESRIIDGVEIKVTAPDGVFPEGASLSVQKVTAAAEQSEVDAAIEEERETNVNVAVSYTYDIKISDADGTEIQPNGEVSISFSMPENTNTNLDTAVYHIDDDMNATAMDVEVVSDVATVTSDSFSYYTVEFTYDEKEYVLQGGDVILLKDLLGLIGLTGEVSAWEVSNNELFDIYRADEKEGLWYDYIDEMEVPRDNANGTILYFVSLKPFDTQEWLKVTIEDITYEIVVTDGIIINDVDVGDIEGIEQGPDATNFTQNIPIATIWIDETRINMSRQSRDKGYVDGGLTAYAKATYGDDFLEGINNVAGATASGAGTYLGDNFVAVNMNKADGLPMGGRKKYPGDIAEFVYKGAAKDANGTVLDVYITYSNLELYFQKNITAENWNDMIDNMALTLWSGNMADINGMKLNDDKDGVVWANAGTGGKNQRVGAVWDTLVQVKYPVDYPDPDLAGKAVEGTFYFPMVDIDVNRADNANFGQLNSAENHNNFSEETFIYRESIDPSSKIYIPGADTSSGFPSYSTLIDTSNPDGWRFYPSGRTLPSAWDKSFYSGFISLIDNNVGLKTTNQFGGTGTAPVEMYFIVGAEPIQFMLKSSTTTYDKDGQRIGGKNDGGPEGTVGGRIQTTQYGNKDGTLFDDSTVIDESTVATVVGQKVKYTMTPEPGYEIKGKVIVNQGSLNYNDATGTVPVKTDPNTGAVTRYNERMEIDPEPVYDSHGNLMYYTYEFWQYSGINENNSIHVEMETDNIKDQKKRPGRRTQGERYL